MDEVQLRLKFDREFDDFFTTECFFTNQEGKRELVELGFNDLVDEAKFWPDEAEYEELLLVLRSDKSRTERPGPANLCTVLSSSSKNRC